MAGNRLNFAVCIVLYAWLCGCHLSGCVDVGSSRHPSLFSSTHQLCLIIPNEFLLFLSPPQRRKQTQHAHSFIMAEKDPATVATGSDDEGEAANGNHAHSGNDLLVQALVECCLPNAATSEPPGWVGYVAPKVEAVDDMMNKDQGDEALDRWKAQIVGTGTRTFPLASRQCWAPGCLLLRLAGPASSRKPKARIRV